MINLDVVVPISGVSIALLGLSFLAFRHPHIYRRMHFGVVGAAVLVVLAITIHNEGWSDAYELLSTYIVPEKLAEARDQIYQRQIPYNWTLLGFFCLISYLFLLYFLRPLLRRERLSPAKPGPDYTKPTPQPNVVAPNPNETLELKPADTLPPAKSDVSPKAMRKRAEKA